MFGNVSPWLYPAGMTWAAERKVELLVLLFVVLLPFGETSHLAVAMLLSLGIRNVWRKGWPEDRDTKAFVLISLALIVPLLIAATGAYETFKTLRTSVIFALYAFAGMYVVRHFRKSMDVNLVIHGIAGILLFWTADALLQYFRGTNLFGWPGHSDGITGIYNRKYWIGYTFAHLAPFLFESLRRLAVKPGRKWIWLLAIPFAMVVMLSGRRAAWITLGLVSTIYLIWLIHRGDLRMRHGLIAATIFVMAAGATIALSPTLTERIQTTMQVFSGTWEGINTAGALRLEVWRGAWLLYKESPLTGVGAHAYDPHAFERGYTSMRFGHTHLYGLDVLLSTGVVGLAAFMAVLGYLVFKLLEAAKLALPAFPAWLAAVAIMFPLNAHWNFYAPRPASLLWMLLTLAIALAAHFNANQSDAQTSHDL